MRHNENSSLTVQIEAVKPGKRIQQTAQNLLMSPTGNHICLFLALRTTNSSWLLNTSVTLTFLITLQWGLTLRNLSFIILPHGICYLGLSASLTICLKQTPLTPIYDVNNTEIRCMAYIIMDFRSKFARGERCVSFSLQSGVQDLSWLWGQKFNITLTFMLLLVYNHLKLRNVLFSVP